MLKAGLLIRVMSLPWLVSLAGLRAGALGACGTAVRIVMVKGRLLGLTLPATSVWRAA
jgi:hypothetical protein